MRNVFIYCLLSVWSIVETTPLSITGHVGGDVNFTCSDWDVWRHTDVERNTKYVCKNPCHTDEDKTKAEYGKTTVNNRISLTNSGKHLFVSITKLNKSDSGTYICGLERSFLADSHLQVHLNVKDAPVTTVKMMTPITTVKMTTTTSTFQHHDVSIMIAIVSTTMLHESSSSSSLGTGLVVSLAVVLAVTVVAVLMFYIKSDKKPQVTVLSAGNITEDVGETHTNEETRGEDQSTGTPCLTMSPVYATDIYANVNDYTHQDPSDLTCVTVLPPEVSRAAFCVDLRPNQNTAVDTKMSQSVNGIPDDDFYTLAQLPNNLKENYHH